jgi:DNA-binding transcriptional LysR family regulator
MHRRNVFELDALRLLVVVARTGSFTAAATELNYTQSAVSRRIATLEAQAGGPLFERLPRGVRLNPAGQALHRHAEEIMARLARAANELAAIHGGYGSAQGVQAGLPRHRGHSRRGPQRSADPAAGRR